MYGIPGRDHKVWDQKLNEGLMEPRRNPDGTQTEPRRNPSGTQTELTLVADNLLDSDQGTVVPVITGGDQTGGAGSANLVAAQDLCKVIIRYQHAICKLTLTKPNDKTPHAKSNFAFPVRSSNGRVRLAPLPYPPIAFP